MSRPVVVYGAGGHGREIAALIGGLCADGADWELMGWLSDEASTWGKVVAGLPILGDGEWLKGRSGTAVVLGIGSPLARKSVRDRIAVFDPTFPAFIDARAVVLPRTRVAPGCVVMAGGIVSVDTILGEFSSLNHRSSVSHDCRMGAFATLGPSVTLAGNVTLGEGVEIGAGGTCIPSVSVGAWSRVGAGAVVISDLPANCTAIGVPARPVSGAREPSPGPSGVVSPPRS